MKERVTEFKTTCPFCGAAHELASSVVGPGEEPALPGDGHVTLCVRCGEWSVYASDAPGGLRKPNDEEYSLLADDPRVRAIRKAWAQTIGTVTKKKVAER
jgi:ribosomal protein S27AE